MRKQKMPMPVNLNDCCLLYQMGYAAVIHDGKVGEVTAEEKWQKESCNKQQK